MMKDDYEAWMVIENVVPVAAKLAKTEICQEVCKETQNKNDKEDKQIL